MIYLLAAFGVVCFGGGLLVGYKWRARQDSAAMQVAVAYKAEADAMRDRLVELEEALMEDD